MGHVRGPEEGPMIEFYACSVHLTGGRFDDEAYEASASTRIEQLRAVLNTVRAVNESGMSGNGHGFLSTVPLLIAGDFNAYISHKVAKKTLRTHKGFHRAVKKGHEKAFLDYITAGHDFLHQNGFKAAYYPDDAPGKYVGARVNRTSTYGGVVDWIYFSRDIVTTQQYVPKIIDCIGRGVSDHQ